MTFFNVILCSYVAMVIIFYVLFMKSFEHLHVKVPDVLKDCASSACHLGQLTLELKSLLLCLEVNRHLIFNILHNVMI